MQKQVNIKGALRRLHYGPGDHPSGSPQDVHAGNGAGGWWQDNPRARGRDWTPGPNTMTAGYKEAKVDPRDIAKLPGARGEEKRIDWDRVRALAESIKAEGLRYKPLIIVEQDRTAYIWEGNHRVRAAIEAGLESIIVEIRYFGGSEELDGIWKPELVSRHYGPGPHPSGSPQSAHSGKAPYQKIKVNLGEGKTRIVWTKRGKISTSFGITGMMFSVVDKYGEFKNELIIVAPDDIVWQKPARMNLKYAELEIVERHGVHIGQEGRPGQVGGSQAGFKHVTGGERWSSDGGGGQYSVFGNRRTLKATIRPDGDEFELAQFKWDSQSEEWILEGSEHYTTPEEAVQVGNDWVGVSGTDPKAEPEELTTIERLRDGENSNDLVNEYWDQDTDEFFISRDEAIEFLQEIGAPEDRIERLLPQLQDFPNDEFDPHEVYYMYQYLYGESKALWVLNRNAAGVEPIAGSDSILEEFSNNIAQQQDYETGVIWDRNMDMALTKDGNEDSVLYPANESKLASDGMLLHNHPRSTGLSIEDSIFAFETGAREIHAVGKDDSRFVLRINPILPIRARQMLAQIMKNETGFIKSDIDDLYTKGELNSDQAWTELYANPLMSLERRFPNLIDYQADGWDHYDMSERIKDWEDTSK